MQKEKSEAARELYSILEPTLRDVYSRIADGSYLGCVTDLNVLSSEQADRFRAILQEAPELVTVIPRVIDQALDTSFESIDKSSDLPVDNERTPIQLVRLPSLRTSSTKESTEGSKQIEIVVWHFYHLIELAYSWQTVEESFFSELDASMKENEDDWYIDEGWLNFKIALDCEIIKWARLLQVINQSIKLYIFPNETWLLVEKKLIDRYKYKHSVKRRSRGRKAGYVYSGK